MDHVDDLLTPAEAAKRARVHPATIRLWIRTGKLAARRDPGGSRYWIHAADLDAAYTAANPGRAAS